MVDAPPLILKSQQYRRLQKGHFCGGMPLWGYANEVDTAKRLCASTNPAARGIALKINSSVRELEVQLLGCGSQAPGHRIHPAIAETEYLKALFL